ncbi:MAG TPA: hypothetical protein VNU64_04950, partial [Burkholderiales bacterium]|nr:hypothetical protein [Burkholderiales bacterium]
MGRITIGTDNHNLLVLSSDAYWEVDAGHRFIRFSGADPAWTAALESSDVFRAALGERRPFRDLELARRDDGGHSHWISLSGEPVLDPGGRFNGYRGLAKDISAQKRDQALVALEHSIARALASADTSNAGLEAVIRAICELLGWPVGRYFSVDEAGAVLRFAQGW